jgi:hypothetical protein
VGGRGEFRLMSWGRGRIWSGGWRFVGIIRGNGEG